MSKCYGFKLHLEPIPFGADITEPRTIETYVYSDTGKDIEQRFTPHKVTDIKEMKDPNKDVFTSDSGWRSKKYAEKEYN
jgi:hypothetical protein